MKKITNSHCWLLVAIVGLGPVQMTHADETVTGKLMQGLFNKAKAAVTGDASGNAASNGDRSLRSEPQVGQTSGFRDFLSGGATFNEPGFFPTTKPRIDGYYLPNGFPGLEYSDINGLDAAFLGSFLQHGYGYRNGEQAFCDTLRHTIIEENGSSPASRKTNAEVINALLNEAGSASVSTYDGYATRKIKFIDEFGGDLASQTKKNYLTNLLQKKPVDLEAIRFLTKTEADAFEATCYAAVGGGSDIDPLEFAPPEEDYLLNKVPEVRDYLAKQKTEQDTRRSQEAARAARDRKIELERQAKEQEAALAQQKALEQRQAKDAAEAERLQQAMTQKQQEQSALTQKQEAREKAAQDQTDAEARRKAALEALGR